MRNFFILAGYTMIVSKSGILVIEMSWDENFFDSLEFEEIELEGMMVKVPIVQRDMSRINAYLLIDAEKAQAIMPSSLVPASALSAGPLPEGKAALYIGITEKRAVDGMQMLPYTEVFIGIPVIYQAPMPMYYVIQVPNTSTEAVDGVKALWNFPSFLCDVTCEETDDAISSTVLADGQIILTLKVPKGPTDVMTMPTGLISVRDDGEIRVAHGLQQFEACMTDGSDATVEFGDHPLVDKLKDLDIGPCIASIYQPKIQYWLDAAR